MAGPPLGEDPLNATNSEYPSAPSTSGRTYLSLEIDQQVDMAVEEPFYSDYGDFPVNLQGLYEGEPLYVDTSINSYPLNTTGDIPTSVDHSNFSVHPVDMPQGMGWTGSYQYNGTINPKDLLLRAA